MSSLLKKKKKDSQALQVKNILNRGLSKISYNEINIKSKIIIQPALRCLCLVQVLNYLILLADHFATCHKILKIRGKKYLPMPISSLILAENIQKLV